jgi:hypothetical protein
MSNKRKLRKEKEAKTTDYTVDDLITDAVDSFGTRLQAAMDEAKKTEKHGVMTILETGEAFVCELVPFGRVWRAGSREAVQKMLDKQGKQDS